MRLLPKIVLAVVVPVLIGTSGVLYVLTGSWRQTLESGLVESARRALVARIDTVSAGLFAGREILRLLALAPQLQTDDLSAIRRTLREWNHRTEQFEGFYFFTPDGVSHAGDGDAVDIRDRSYFSALAHGDEVLGEPLVSRYTNRPVLLLTVPVRDAAGRLRGSVGGTILLGAFLERTIADAQMHSGGFLLLDRGGALLAGGLDGETPLLQRPQADSAPLTAAVTDAVMAAVQEEEVRPALRVAASGQTMRVLHAPVPHVSWRLVYVQPDKVLLAPLLEANRLGWVVGGAASLAALLVALLLYHLIVHPVRQLTFTHRRLEGGERAARAEVRGSDEFTALAESFNRLADTLQRSERKFSAVFEASPYVITLSRASDGALLDVNPAFERITGYLRKEALGHNLIDLGLVADPAGYVAERSRLLGAGRLDGMVFLARDRAGGEHWAMTSSRLIELDGETVLVSLTADISVQKANEQSLREHEKELQASEMWLRSLFDVSPVAVLILDLGGRVTDCNRRFPEMIDRRRDEIVGRSYFDFIHPDETQAAREGVGRLLENPSLQVFSAERAYLRRDGCLVHGLLSARRLPAAGGGEDVLMVIISDITELRRAEAMHRESEIKLQAVFNASPVAMIVSDMGRDFAVVAANEAWERQFLHVRDELIGRSGTEVGLWASQEDRQHLIDGVRREGFVEAFETSLVRGDGAHILCRVSARTVTVGGVDLLVMVQEDVTGLRDAENALQLVNAQLARQFALADAVARAQSDFIANLESNDGFESLLTDLLRVCESEYGFIGEVLFDAAARPFLRTNAITNIAWDDESRRLFEASAVTGFEFRNLDSLFGAALRSGAPVIANDPASDPRRGGLPRGHPPLRAFLGVPIRVGGRLVAMIGVANRPGGYHAELVEWLQPLLATIGQMIEARRAALARQAAETALRELNEQLDTRVRERTAELNRSNEELSGALEALKRTQGDLIRSEKLAGLGALVAGVAHELNTPIGNSVTVASTLHDRSDSFAEEMQGTLKRSALVAYVEHARHASALLLANLQRAADLVTSFKQVAVDQTSDQRRRFDVAGVVGEILAMLQPQMKKLPLRVTVDIPAGIELDSYPGPFGQVVANLVNNAVLHGFDDGRNDGTIEISARLDGDRLRLTVRDDGAGIASGNIARIFDPFFTTRLGKGGSGLGLNIVYNIVANVLGGKITVESEVGKGASFNVELPAVAPVAATPTGVQMS